MLAQKHLLLILVFIFGSLVACQGVSSEESVVHYRLLGQIEAFQEDGGVNYPEYVADTGVATVSHNQISIPLSKSEEVTVINYQLDGESLVFTVNDIETEGQLNSWTRIQVVPGSSTFGYDTSCEIWFGTEEPPSE